MEIWKEVWKFGENDLILEKYNVTLEKNWKFGKNKKFGKKFYILKKFGIFEKKFGNCDKIWKFGKKIGKLEINNWIIDLTQANFYHDTLLTLF